MDQINTRKFKNVPSIEEDTIILTSLEIKVRGIDALMEIWIYDKVIQATSIIFVKEEIAHLQDEDLIKIINEDFKYFDVNISRNNPNYVFVNFANKIIKEFGTNKITLEKS